MSPLPDTGLYPAPKSRAIKRVGILFAGGPAPAANAVISTAAACFRRDGIDVIGIMHGYAHLIDYTDTNPMKEGRDYIVPDDVKDAALPVLRHRLVLRPHFLPRPQPSQVAGIPSGSMGGHPWER